MFVLKPVLKSGLAIENRVFVNQNNFFILTFLIHREFTICSELLFYIYELY